MLAQFDSNATTTHIVRVSGTAIYKYASSNWTAITGSVTVTAGDDNTFEWVDANGTIVATNGVDTDGWKWSGSGNASTLDDDGRFSRGKHVAWFNNRLWIGNVNGAAGQLWYSDIADIETWGATSFINFGGIVRGLKPMHNQLVVHTTDGIYTVAPTGNAVNPFIINQRTGRQESSPLAAARGRGIVSMPGGRQAVILEDGIYQWSGGEDLEKISGDLDNRYWPNVNISRLSQSFAGNFPRENEVWFALPYGEDQTKNNHIMVYNHARRWVDGNGELRVGGWHGPYSGFERNCYGLISRKPHLGDFDGPVWDHDAGGYSDNGTSLPACFGSGSQATAGADGHGDRRGWTVAAGGGHLELREAGAALPQPRRGCVVLPSQAEALPARRREQSTVGGLPPGARRGHRDAQGGKYVNQLDGSGNVGDIT